MKDIFYTPGETTQKNLLDYIDNLKSDRTPEDLLFQVMLDLAIPLSSEIKEKNICDCNVFSVANGYLYACLDTEKVSDEVVTEIAQAKPYYAVFRNCGMKDDATATNLDQIFESVSPDTVRKIL